MVAPKMGTAQLAVGVAASLACLYVADKLRFESVHERTVIALFTAVTLAALCLLGFRIALRIGSIGAAGAIVATAAGAVLGLMQMAEDDQIRDLCMGTALVLATFGIGTAAAGVALLLLPRLWRQAAHKTSHGT